MATVKSYTDIKQSKKLADILPIESADMWFINGIIVTRDSVNEPYDIKGVLPCWSIAALLEQFEDEAGLTRDYGLWFCYDNRKSYCTKHYDNPIDACYEMIIKLHERKMCMY